MISFGRRYLLSFIPVGLFARLMVRILHVPKTRYARLCVRLCVCACVRMLMIRVAITNRLIAAWRTGFVMEFITTTKSGRTDNDAQSRNPCLVRAFFEQKTEPHNELVFCMRGHKDELKTDISAVTSSSSSPSPSFSSSSDSTDVVALLEKLVYITDTLFAGFAGAASFLRFHSIAGSCQLCACACNMLT
jgi:hypothetical protein